MESTIKWNEMSSLNKNEYGWKLVVMMPNNYEDFEVNKSEMNRWIQLFGLQRLWWNNGEFWLDHKEITDRVIFWAELPEIPDFK